MDKLLGKGFFSNFNILFKEASIKCTRKNDNGKLKIEENKSKR